MTTKPEPRRIEVRPDHDEWSCPFWRDFECHAPDAPDMTVQDLACNPWDQPEPHWCPLRAGPVVVELSEETT